MAIFAEINLPRIKEYTTLDTLGIVTALITQGEIMVSGSIKKYQHFMHQFKLSVALLQKSTKC